MTSRSEPRVISMQGDALVAGVGGGAALAVERLGEHARRRGLADAADAGEEVGLRDAPLLRGRCASAVTIGSWPTRLEKFCGRHLRART